MADIQTLDQVNVTGSADDTDYLTPVVTKAFASLGQDTTTPEVQAQVTSAISRLRDTNPDASDKTIAQQVATNLPQLVSSMVQTKKIDSGMDEQGQLKALAAQRQTDLGNANQRAFVAPLGYTSLGGGANNEKEANDFIDRAYAPSKTLEAGMKDVNQFYTNQTAKGVANKTAEEAAQAGIKTVGDRQALSQEQLFLDPASNTSQALRSALGQQLQQLGAPASAIARMQGMNVPQMKMFADGFTKTEKERADINLVTQNALTQKTVQGMNRATTAKTGAETRGIESENVVKAYKANSIGNGGGAPEAIAEEVMPAGKNAIRQDNQHAAAVMNAAAPQVADIQQTAETLLQEMNNGADTGYVAAKFKALSSNIQSVNKNLNSLQAGQQGGSGGTAAQANAIAGANPDASYNADVIKQYLISTLGSIARQNLVRDKTIEAVKNGQQGDFERGRYAASLVPIAVIQAGKILSVDAYEPGEVQQAVAALRARNPGAYVGPASSVALPSLKQGH